MATCKWFLLCEEETTMQVEHPTLGWVDICDRHVEWLLEDATERGPNPTKMVPPLATKHGERLQRRLAALEEREEV